MEVINFEAKITIYSNEKLINCIVKFLNRNFSNEKNFRYYIEKPLTKRELEVLKLVTEGKSNTEIGNKLKISSHTVKAHISSILEKLCVKDRIQAAVKATKENLV